MAHICEFLAVNKNVKLTVVFSVYIYAIMPWKVLSLHFKFQFRHLNQQFEYSFPYLLPHYAQVRKQLVEDWLPVLVICKDNVSPMSPSNKSLYLELEETFLRIISTLPMSDAQELLQKCLSFSTRNVEDCPHLVTAFNTWFRRAALPLKPDCRSGE